MKKFVIYLIVPIMILAGVIQTLMIGFGGFGSIQIAKALGINELINNDESHIPEIFIKAVNPGYTVDGTQNVGEMIEIGRKNSDEPISLAGLTIGYTNSSGNTVVLADLSKYIWKAGETILLRLASSSNSGLAHEQYTKTLALKAGPLSLMMNEKIIDLVCWTGKDGCLAAFNSNNPTTIVRNLETGEFEHLPSYEPEFLENNLELIDNSNENNGDSGEGASDAASYCKGLEFSEILSYYDVLQNEQFVELHNRNAEAMQLNGCTIKYKNRYYELNGTIGADGYFVRYATDFKLTKNPTTSNTLELIDGNGEVLDKLVYPNGQKKGTAYALVGYDKDGGELWKTTFAPTPGEPNNYQEFRTCETGKVINEETGNCVKVTSIVEKICGEGQYLNILTGRCRKIPTATETVCKEGYYLNTETGRCKKIQENTGADYALVPETYTEESSFVALYLILGVIGVGLIYVGYEFRHDIMKIVRRLKWW